MCTFQAVGAAGEDGAMILVNAAALPRLVVHHLHHLVVHDAHPRQIDRELLHAAADDLLLPNGPEPHLAVHDAHLHHDLSSDENGLGPQATTVEGYPDMHHDLRVQLPTRAHHHLGSQGHDLVPHHVVAGDPPVVQ